MKIYEITEEEKKIWQSNELYLRYDDCFDKNGDFLLIKNWLEFENRFEIIKKIPKEKEYLYSNLTKLNPNHLLYGKKISPEIAINIIRQEKLERILKYEEGDRYIVSKIFNK